MATMDVLTGIAVGLALAVVLWVAWRVFWAGKKPSEDQITVLTIADRVRAVGKLVGLEVSAKEIATETRGLSWMPPLVLSQAKLAMIFHFEKQYFIDLSKLNNRDVEEIVPGHFKLRLPPIEGALRLREMTPYDIQDGRVLGLLDVIQMNADRQRELMQRAQRQASGLYESGETRYYNEARRSIERHVESLLALFGVHVDIEWPDPEPATDEEPEEQP